MAGRLLPACGRIGKGSVPRTAPSQATRLDQGELRATFVRALNTDDMRPGRRADARMELAD
jgi:hypothetical protein